MTRAFYGSVSNEVLRDLEPSSPIKNSCANFINRHSTCYIIQPIRNFDQSNNQENLLSGAPSFASLDSQIDLPKID